LTLVSPDFNGITRAKKLQDELKIAFPNLKTSKNKLISLNRTGYDI